MNYIIVCMFLMFLTTYLIRVIPIGFVRKKMENEWIQDFIYYIPFCVLSAMTFPAVFYATGDVTSSVVGTVVALVMAYFDLPLIVVALAASLTAFITGFFF